MQVPRLHIPNMSEASASSPPGSPKLPTTTETRATAKSKMERALKKLPLTMNFVQENEIVGSKIESKVKLMTDTNVGTWAEMQALVKIMHIQRQARDQLVIIFGNSRILRVACFPCFVQSPELILTLASHYNSSVWAVMLAPAEPTGYPTPLVSLDPVTFQTSLGIPQFDKASVVTRTDALKQFT